MKIKISFVILVLSMSPMLVAKQSPVAHQKAEKPSEVKANANSERAIRKFMDEFNRQRLSAQSVDELKAFFSNHFLEMRGEVFLKSQLKKRLEGELSINSITQVKERSFVTACSLQKKSQKCVRPPQVWVVVPNKKAPKSYEIVDVYDDVGNN